MPSRSDSRPVMWLSERSCTAEKRDAGAAGSGPGRGGRGRVPVVQTRPCARRRVRLRTASSRGRPRRGHPVEGPPLRRAAVPPETARPRDRPPAPRIAALRAAVHPRPWPLAGDRASAPRALHQAITPGTSLFPTTVPPRTGFIPMTVPPRTAVIHRCVPISSWPFSAAGVTDILRGYRGEVPQHSGGGGECDGGVRGGRGASSGAG